MFTSGAIIAILAAVCSILVKVIGMPIQIKINHQRKSTDGLSSWFLVLTFISYCLWVAHGLVVHDMALVIGQGLGVIVTGIIVGQMISYRKQGARKKSARPVILWYASMLQKKNLKASLKKIPESNSRPKTYNFD
jgi:uncharacterized protein with PQ loop repeat